MPLNHSKIFHYPLFKFLNIQKVKLFKYLNKYSESTTRFKVWRSSEMKCKPFIQNLFSFLVFAKAVDRRFRHSFQKSDSKLGPKS